MRIPPASIIAIISILYSFIGFRAIWKSIIYLIGLFNLVFNIFAEKHIADIIEFVLLYENGFKNNSGASFRPNRPIRTAFGVVSSLKKSFIILFDALAVCFLSLRL